MDEIKGVIVTEGPYKGRRGRILRANKGWFRCELWTASAIHRKTRTRTLYKTVVSLRPSQFNAVTIRGEV